MMNLKPDYDLVIQDIAEYVLSTKVFSPLAYENARWCLMDALGCGMLALNFPACTKLLGPIVPGAVLPGGSRVPGTHYELEPVHAAFNIGTMVRWLDFNDTWLAAEWGHPSDNLGAILAVSDYVSRQRVREGGISMSMLEVLTAMIKAYEIQGCLALENSFNRHGLDHVVLVKVASSAVAMMMLGGSKEDVMCVISQAFVDGQSLRTYRHAPNTGSRKSWAAGDASSRGVRFALMTAAGEMGYPSALTAPQWGFYDVLFASNTFKLSRSFDCYVIENILFKLAYPAEFHAQTAVECAVILHPTVKNCLNQIAKIELVTHESAMRIISKDGPLYNPADRDHCLQYMVAVALIFGDLRAEHYEDEIAMDPRIDELRKKISVVESAEFSKDYLNTDKRSIPNSMRIIFKDGHTSDWICIEYPLGHPRRRNEGVPVLLEKCKNNLLTRFSEQHTQIILNAMQNTHILSNLTVFDFMGLWSGRKDESHNQS